MIINAYHNEAVKGPRSLFRRRFTSTNPEDWTQMDLDSIQSLSDGSKFDFKGMFRVGDKTYALNGDTNMVHEINWNAKDQMVLKNLVSF